MFVNSIHQMRKIVRPLLTFKRHITLPSENFIISGYPKSGSTYLRFLLYAYLTGNTPQYEGMESFIPYIGRARTQTDDPVQLFKTHELPNSKYKSGVFLIRDGRPVTWSLYRSMKRRETFVGEFSDFLRLQLAGKVGGYGSWQHHTQSWLDFISSDTANWGVLHYEDLIGDPSAALFVVLEAMRLEPDASMVDHAVRSCTPDAIRRAEMEAPIFATLIKAGKTPIVGDGFKQSWCEAFSENDMSAFDRSASRQIKTIEQYRRPAKFTA